MNTLIEMVSTFFYLGYFPFAPGTVGSFVGVFIYFLTYRNFFLYISVTAIFLVLGFLYSGRAQKIVKRKDAPCIIIDEIAGMLLSLVFVPFGFKEVFLTFLLFRIFDTLKFPPADRLQKKQGSLGIMADDIVAAGYSILIIQLVLRVLVSIGS